MLRFDLVAGNRRIRLKVDSVQVQPFWAWDQAQVALRALPG
ncbi:hypothetical protein LTSERUB_6133 [Salmonella enterica subsp. enterica serovar Rubislaw str. A4-653]|uniref:Uncharacterized protein n=1 Tax=Salmonella enterica subsp. enterica serovar Rubislaw str. A4-653 TaxID=913081 RepID=G5QSF2_SALRU|nr:hypothetical protein LTSERUB_6133 [Salmonella enterica subsp. enterica serovar Rubislaw str. A4-653]